MGQHLVEEAEQIFLRGFDIDHGTDTVLFQWMGCVNMVLMRMVKAMPICICDSETVEKIDFGKGTYYASKGILQRQDTITTKLKEIKKSSISNRGWSV
jgi:hypothetical protein